MVKFTEEILNGKLHFLFSVTTIINCRKGERPFFRKMKSYRALKLTDQILKIANRSIEKMIRQQANIDEMQFGFMKRCGTKNAIFIIFIFNGCRRILG